MAVLLVHRAELLPAASLHPGHAKSGRNVTSRDISSEVGRGANRSPSHSRSVASMRPGKREAVSGTPPCQILLFADILAFEMRRLPHLYHALTRGRARVRVTGGATAAFSASLRERKMRKTLRMLIPSSSAASPRVLPASTKAKTCSALARAVGMPPRYLPSAFALAMP
jgi:hypothetical protein